jgi:hypothetical protein
VNVNVAVLSVVATSGPFVIVTVGGVMSPLAHVYSAGDRSTAPIGPRARTSSSCSPYGKFVSVAFPSEPAHAANGSESREHSKVAPAGSAEKTKVACVLSISGSGPETIVVSGSPSVVHV